MALICQAKFDPSSVINAFGQGAHINHSATAIYLWRNGKGTQQSMCVTRLRQSAVHGSEGVVCSGIGSASKTTMGAHGLQYQAQHERRLQLLVELFNVG